MPRRIAEGMRRFSLTRRDGAPLAGYQGGTKGPVLVLANGLGGPVSAFRHQLSHFKDRYRILTWDYRGLYGSRSVDPPVRVDIPAQADDLEDLLAAAAVDRAIFVGWSMGVQVVLELCARRPDLASALVLINGTYRQPFASLRLPGSELFLPGLVERAREHHALGERIVRRLSRSRRAAEWVRRLRLVSPALSTDELLDLAREFETIDLEVYLRTLAELHRHDASRGLGGLDTRALVVTGARDPLFSPRVARELAGRLRRSEVYVVPKATHYAPVEFPALLNERIDRFLSEGSTVRSPLVD
jgi:pimeloyl-ACP methyl ester carboxylesterase